MSEYFLLIIGAILVNNLVLTRFPGICLFRGASGDIPTAAAVWGRRIET